MTNLERDRVKKLALKVVLSIEGKKSCTLVDHCKALFNIVCTGDRIPGCLLEKGIMEGRFTYEDITKIKAIPILQHLVQLDKKLNHTYKDIKPMFYPKASDFSCPYLKNLSYPCCIPLCVYHSPKVVKTNCILSFVHESKESWLDTSKFAILKDIHQDVFVKIVYKKFDKWGIIERFLERWDKDIHFCADCGYLLSQCRRYHEACAERKKIYAKAKWEIPLHIKDEYPLFLIISCFRRIFKQHVKYLVPGKLLDAYSPPK